MPAYFQRPENALKRANEFMDVGKRQRALETLSDVIKSKRHRTWQKVHEPIMQKYLQLCVELRKSHIAKEGLYQYKNICQQVNIASLVDVVRCYIQLAEERTEAAREKSHQKVVDVDDLDLPDSPESILLKAVSGEDTQDRTDRAILTPWVKFLWESYRQCLDLLRNNSRVERLYQDIAQQAFKFCLKYARKTEFRKLCDNLRTHLGHIHKHQHQQTAINLNNPDSQAMHLETRLVQLDSAINMELWQEAFKAVEDIHGLISLSKKPPRPSLMANYYQKLGLVFWKSGNRLFHASTLHRLYHLSREQRKNLATEELTQMASRVLCATLAVQIPPSRNAIGELLEMNESTMEKKRHLATLLMLPNPPTRQGLIKDLVKHNVIQNVYPELQNLYRWLEVDFHPLSLYKRVTTPLDVISKNDELSQYVPALEDIVITRVLKQVSQVYQTIEFARLASLVPFATQFRLERVIVDAKKTLELQVRINHQTRSLSFGTNLDVAQREDVPEGPYIQSMPSEQIRNQLTEMARSLHKALTFIVPHEKQVERDNLKVKIMGEYRTSAKREHTKILQRRQIIEDRKEQLEHFNDQREKEEMEEMEAQKSKAYEEEMARLEREVEERKKHRAVLEHQEIKRKHVKERIEQLRKSEMGSKFLENFDEEDIADLDVDEIMQKQVEQLEKEKKELNERLKLQERKVDHIVRAQRLEELPLLEKKIEENQVEAKAFWEKQEKERIENLIEERKHALETKNRLRRIKEDKDLFMEKLQDTRTSEYEDKLAEFQTLLKKERQKRLQERKEKRKIERREKWYKEREEERQRIRDEQMLREREAKEAEERARREEEEKEYEEKYKRLQEQAEKQRLREQEIEEKLKQKQSDKHPAASPEQRNIRIKPGDSEREPDTWRRGQREMRDEDPNEKKAWRPAPKEGGGWREREKERENSWKKEPSRGEDEPSTWRKHEGGGGWREREAERAPRDDRDFDRGPREDRDERGWRRDEERGPKRDFGRDERGPRDFRRDDRGPRDFDRDDRGPRDFARDDRGPRDFGRDDRGPRDFGRDDRGPRDFGRDDRGPRDFGRDDRGQRDFERDDRGPRDLGRDDRGPRDFGRDDRGPRDFGRDDRGPRDFGRDDRGSRDFRRDDRGPRDFGRDDRGPRRDFGREDRSPREEQGSWRGGGGGRRDDEATPRRDGGGAWRATPRASEEGGGWRSRMAAKEGGERPTQAASKGDESVGRKEEDGWTVVTK